jgi:Pentapeptide repeats (8 copies)
MSRRLRWLGFPGALLGFVLVAYVVLKLAPDLFAETDGLDAKGRSDARQGVRTATLALLAGGIALVGALYTARTFALNRAGQLTDRFTKAIEQLGHKEELDVRLGGIYALERIARDSEQDHPQVMEVLTAYIREHARREDVPPDPLRGKHLALADPASDDDDWDPTEVVRPATDVQAALTVLGRRDLAHEPGAAAALDLRYTDLRGARFQKNFEAAIFAQSDLRGASFRAVDLRRAYFVGDLRGADFTGANLERSSLMASDLSKALLNNADLSRSTITATKFTGAVVDERTRWPPDFDGEAAINDHRRKFGPPIAPD